MAEAQLSAAEFRGRVALVTGAGQGLGRASAWRLHQGGAAVACLDRDAARVREVASAIQAAGGSAQALVADASDRTALAAAVDQVHQALGPIGLVHANAGIQRYGDALATPEELWDEVMRVNVTSAFLTVQAALPDLIASGEGAIVLTSSAQAFATQRGVVAYTTSKAALVGLCRALAIDHADQGVRVNCVCPGSVDTPMLRAAAARFAAEAGQEPAGVLQGWGRAHPLQRLCRAEEVAEVAAFLLSPRASYITGAAVPVDGGLLARLGVILPD